MFSAVGIGLKLLGIGQAIGRAVKGALRWTLSDIRHVAIVALLACVAVLWLQNGKWERRAEKAIAIAEKRGKTIAEMRAASEASKQAALANAARVKAEYERIADNAKISYDRALADNRASVERWKLQNRRGATRQGDSPAAAEVSTGIAGTETLPLVPDGFALVPTSDLDKTAVIQATLFALQQAARDVGKVETAPE